MKYECPADQSESVQKKRAQFGQSYYDKYASQNGVITNTAKEHKSTKPESFKVSVDIPNLNIRKGAGTNYGVTGKFTGKGVFTITEVKKGKGSTSGWGRLKSGAGWISLDYATRL